MDQYLYLTINMASLLVPFLFSFYPKHPFYKHWKNYFAANLIVAAFFIAWDIWFTKMGVWGFNPHYLTGIYFFNLPIEEVLFFIIIPYCSVFVYFSIQYLIPKNPFQKSQRWITLNL